MIKVDLDMGTIQSRLAGISRGLRDLSPVWPKVHEIVLQFFKKTFQTQGAYPGQAWVALNPSYAAWKRAHYGGLPILQLHGTLMGSLTDPEHVDHVYRFGPAFMETGTSTVYARTHQWGYPPRNIPARPPVQRPTKVEGARIVDAIFAWLLGEARRKG